jgi:hypothetical protein
MGQRPVWVSQVNVDGLFQCSGEQAAPDKVCQHRIKRTEETCWLSCNPPSSAGYTISKDGTVPCDDLAPRPIEFLVRHCRWIAPAGRWKRRELPRTFAMAQRQIQLTLRNAALPRAVILKHLMLRFSSVTAEPRHRTLAVIIHLRTTQGRAKIFAA